MGTLVVNALYPCLFVFVVMRDIIHYCYKGFKEHVCQWNEHAKCAH